MKPKRLGIYLVYDRQNVVDQYIGYFLKELRDCVSTLAVVCNMEHITRGEEILRRHADQVYFRRNLGFDAGGFKDALCNLIGWETVLGCDELVLANDSMFGPFRPMREIFAEMEKKPADFWGLTAHGAFRGSGSEHIPEHVQSFFLVIRSKMLHSGQFKAYWEAMPYFSSFEEVIHKYEMRFTPHFSALGYTYDVLADVKANDSANLENNYCQFLMIPCELMEKRNFPFLKKKSLVYDLSDVHTQESLRQAVDYADRETGYDVDLIWENIVRLYNPADLHRMLHLQYIIPPVQNAAAGKAAVLLFASYEESVPDMAENLKRLGKSCDVKILSNQKELLRLYQGYGYDCRELPEENNPAILKEFWNYDYVCVLHDVDLTSQKRFSYIGKSYFYSLWENLLKNEAHTDSVKALFQKEPRLGFLAPPQPSFGAYFGDFGRGWDGNYNPVQAIVKKAGINCQISEDKPPYRVTSDFWTRGCILKRLEALEGGDYEYLPYLWSYLAQDAGYYSGVVESSEYAGMNEVNLQHYLNLIASQVREQSSGFHFFFEMQKRIVQPALLDFCSRFPTIYVYGTGAVAKRFQDMLPGIEAYLVSDGQMKAEDINGTPVRYLSEADLTGRCGIILCLNRSNQAQVIKLLEMRGFKNYFCVQ